MKADRKLFPVVFPLLMFSGWHSEAQNLPADRKFSFDQAMEMALRNSHVMKQVDYLKNERNQETQAAKSLRFPTIGVTGSYLLMSDDIQLNLTPVRDAITPLYSALSNYGNFSGVANYSDDVSTQIVRAQLKQGLQTVESTNWDQIIQQKLFGTITATVQWPIYAGGKIKAANAAAMIQEKEADEQLMQKSGELISELAERYFGLCLAQQVVKVRQDVFNGMENHLQDALKMEKQGFIPHADVLNAQVYQAQAKRDLDKAMHTVAILNEALSNTLALKEDTSIVPTTGLFYLDAIESVGYFKEIALKNNPLLQQVQTKKQLAQQGVVAEKAELYPTLAMQGMYNVANMDLSPYLPAWMVGVGLKWTLFDDAARSRKIKAAVFKTNQISEAEQKAQSDVITMIEKLYRELDMYREQLNELDTDKTFAEEYVRVREKAFHEDMTNATDVVDARLALSKVRIERLEAMYGYDKTLADILQYAGIPSEYSTYLKRAGVITESY